jgi:hypothetical protein
VLKNREEAITIISDGYLLGMKKTKGHDNLSDSFLNILSKIL